MRGKPGDPEALSASNRITPADAGKTAQPRRADSFLKDHPRGCGENNTAGHKKPAGTGSPPRMRGKLVILPFGISYFKDHPRGCGENNTAGHKKPAGTGSPPRMRGKLEAC